MNKKIDMKLFSYDFPAEISTVICSDLDETFLPFKDENKHLSGIGELEQLLADNISKHGLIFGWITGSNLQSALRKTKGYITKLPHFVGSGLGTEFHWIKGAEIEEPVSWTERITKSGFKKENVDIIIKQLADNNIRLRAQNSDYQGKYKSCYFYYAVDERREADFRLIKELAEKYDIKVMLNKCNPSAGDPENSYDVEFIPKCCGKGEIIDFLKEELGLSEDSFYAFGDSFNDFSMFEKAGTGYLVGNADPAAKKVHKNVLEKYYCAGIAEKLRELLSIR